MFSLRRPGCINQCVLSRPLSSNIYVIVGFFCPPVLPVFLVFPLSPLQDFIYCHSVFMNCLPFSRLCARVQDVKMNTVSPALKDVPLWWQADLSVSPVFLLRKPRWGNCLHYRFLWQAPLPPSPPPPKPPCLAHILS